MKNKGILFLTLLLILTFWKFFVPGSRVASDFPYVFHDQLKSGMSFPSTWNERGGEGMGENGILTMWSWPNDYIFGFLATLDVSFDILERLFILLAIILGVFSINKLLKGYNMGCSGIFVATIFYLTTTYFILLIDGGQHKIAFAYTFLPLAFILFKKAIDGNLKSKIFAGLGIFILGFLDIRFVFVLLVLLFLLFLYELIFISKEIFLNWCLDWIYSALVSGVIFLGLNFYWILPMVLVKDSSVNTLFSRLTQTSSFEFTTLGHALFLLQPHWFKNVFGQIISLEAEFVLIPILAFLAPVFKKKNKAVGFWLLAGLVGLFLTKGSNPPLGGIYNWLFDNIPGFSLFRDSTKFFFLVSLSYSILIAFSIDELSRQFKWKLRIGNWKITFVSLLLTSYYLLLIRPVWLGKMTGTFSDPVYKKEFSKLANILMNDNNFGRIFWIPSRSPLGFASPLHPVAEALRLVERRPFAIGTVGTYEIFNFLREAQFTGGLFDIAGIGYIAYPFPDTRREELSQDDIDYYHNFSDQLSNLDWIDGKISDYPVNVFKANENQDRFFLTGNTFLVVGSDRIYKDLVNVEGFKLSNNALIFAEESPGLGSTCKDRPCAVLLFDKTNLDFAATFIDKSDFIFPAQILSSDPNETGWWKRDTKDFLWWRNFLQQKYSLDNQDFDFGGGYAIAESNRELLISNNKFQNSNLLLVRAMESSRGDVVEFYQGEMKIGDIVTKVEAPERIKVKLTGYKEIPDQVFEYDKADFRWFEVGRLLSSQPITIKTEGDINVVNSLVVIPQTEWQRINDIVHENNTIDCINDCTDDRYQTSSSNNQYTLVEWNKLRNLNEESIFASELQPSVSYKRINSTHYAVKITGLSRPVTLAFSETFDTLWEIRNVETGETRNSYPLYSLINSFYVEKDGEYDIYFSPQKYVYPGLTISAATLLVIIVIFFPKKKPQKLLHQKR